jgi:hypothetical protein
LQIASTTLSITRRLQAVIFADEGESRGATADFGNAARR